MATELQRQWASGPGEIRRELKHVTARLRRNRWIRYGARGALGGVLISIIAAIFAYFDLLPDWLPLEAVIPISVLLGIGIGTITAYARPISPMEAARLVETRLGLKERLSSALEFESAGYAPRNLDSVLLFRLQQQDALAHARTVRPQEAAPFRFTWELKALIAAVIVLIAILVAPNLPILVPPALRAERDIVRKAGQKLERTAQVIEKKANVQHLAGTKKAAQDMRRLGHKMAAGHMDKKKALVEYSKLTQEMADLQRKLSQTPGAPGAGEGKSLADAGRQLAQALQGAQSQSLSKSANSNPTATVKSGAVKNGASQSGPKSKGLPGQHGFNIPGQGAGSHAQNSGQQQNEAANSRHSQEMRQAAQSMQQGDTKGLSDQLRHLAQRTESGKMPPAEAQQTAQDLQKLSDALKGTPLSETQKHAQAAADAMKAGDNKKAADEMRKAADAADREVQKQSDKQAMQDAQKSLQKSQGQMARSSTPQDMDNASQNNGSEDSPQGQGQPSEEQSGGSEAGQAAQNAAARRMSQMGNSQGSGNGGQGSNGRPGQGQGTSSEPCYENGGQGAANKAGSGQKPGSNSNSSGQNNERIARRNFQGSPQPLSSSFDPSKNPANGRIYLGKPNGGAKNTGRILPSVKATPGPNVGHGQGAVSKVPYYKYIGQAKQSAEKTVDTEDIPPSYKTNVKRYFNSLDPNAQGK